MNFKLVELTLGAGLICVVVLREVINKGYKSHKLIKQTSKEFYYLGK